jgi:hypothetical protein
MTEWTDDERREFNEYRRTGREHTATARIRVGDRVATPGGSGYAIEERLDGFLVKLESGPAADGSAAGGDAAGDGDTVLYLPLHLLRKLDP